jgi:putative ABC transport system permease protein
MFLKIAIRHLWQSKLYACINIAGLSVAITCLLLAIMFWKDERSYDDFHANNPHLYRLVTNIVSKEGKPTTTGGSGQVQGPAFKAAVPEVKSYVRVMGGEIYTDVAAGNKTLHLQPLFVDNNFFDVFSFQLLRGNPGTVLNDISSVVLTETTAKKFFNSTDVVGKVLQMDADPSYERLGKPLIVSGIVKDPPSSSSLQFDALFTFDFMRLSFVDNNWLNAYLGTFIVLHQQAKINTVLKKFHKVYELHAKEQITDKEFNIYGYDPKITYGLQPVNDIHLNALMSTTGNAESGIINGSSPVYSYMFMSIAMFIVLMAAINFINISIANSLKYAKEVGIRKIAGSSKWQIIAQFLNGSAILCFISFVLAIILLHVCLPLFNSLAQKQLVFAEILDVRLIVYFIILLAVIIVLTGLYPAYILSHFKPAEVLYNKQRLLGSNVLGKTLVVVQFSLAVFLLISVIVYYSQMAYIKTKDLGYNPNQVIRTAVSGNRDYKTVISYLKNELAKEPSVNRISFGNDGFTEEAQVNAKKFKAVYKNIDENFLPALEIPLKTGQNFSATFSSDMKNGAIANEAFVKAAGLQNPVGAQVKVNIDWGYDSTVKIITGVVKDFHFGSLREPIIPMLMYMKETPDGGIWIKIERRKQKEALAAIERIYKTAMPGAVYTFNFLDELDAMQYMQEQRWQKIISIATVLSFIVCCLGLFGLAHLSTSRRIKEIGIRKVLGATVSQVVVLLSGDFLKLVFIAFIIAAPVSWIVMSKWLQDFAYRINIEWWMFAAAGFAALLIALVTVSFQSIKTAIKNPVDSLRTE